MILADHVEQASGPDLGIFAQAFFAVHGPRPSRVHGGSIELTTWLNKYNPFYTLVMAGGWIDAAMTLKPKGMWLEVKGPRRYLNIPSPVPNYWSARLDETMGWGATPALALLAAILRLHEQGGEGDE